jgi:hypothetical protein
VEGAHLGPPQEKARQVRNALGRRVPSPPAREETPRSVELLRRFRKTRRDEALKSRQEEKPGTDGASQLALDTSCGCMLEKRGKDLSLLVLMEPSE